MTNKQFLLLLSIVATIFFLPSCKQKDPSVISEPSAKLLAVCEGHVAWAAQETYNYTMERYELNEETMPDYSVEDFEDLKVLLNRACCQYECEVVSGDELHAFLQEGTIPKETRIVKETPHEKDFFDDLLDAVFGVDEEQDEDIRSKTHALELVWDICYGHFDEIKNRLCRPVHIFEYRRNENSSNKKVTVYDVIYVIQNCYYHFCDDDKYGYLADKYVWCTIFEMKDGTFEVRYVNSSYEYADLGF